jgi:hypothetical protein
MSNLHPLFDAILAPYIAPAEHLLNDCRICDERCDAYPCANADPRGPDEIEAAQD